MSEKSIARDSMAVTHKSLVIRTTNIITCPADVIVDAEEGKCGATVNFPDATSNVSPSEEIVMIFNGENVFDSPYIENGMRLDGNDGSHIDAPWPIPCDNRKGALIHANTGNTWTYNGGDPFTPLRFIACTTNMKFTTGCGATFIPQQTGEVEFPDTPEWQNITSMIWEQQGDNADASIDNFRFIATPVKQQPGLESGCFFPVGTTPVTFISTDENGAETECTFNVIVRDVESPVYEVQDIEIDLGDDNSATIDANDVIIDTPTDNCAVDTITLSQSTFTCSDQGKTIIDVTVTDINGNETVKQVNINVNSNATDFPTLEEIEDQAACDTYVLPALKGDNLSGNQAYYTEPGGQGDRYEIGEELSHDSFPFYPARLYAYDNPSGSACFAQKSFQLSIDATPVINTIDDVQDCETYVLPVITGENITAAAAYYTLPDGGGTRYDIGSTITNEDFENPTILYAYDRTASGGCMAQQSFEIALNACPIQVTIDASDDILCANESQSVTLNAQPQPDEPVGTYTYQWNIVGSEEILSTDQSIEILPEETTEYHVIVIDTGASAGFDRASASITINVENAPTALIPDIINLCDNSDDIVGEETLQFVDYNNLFHANHTRFEIDYYNTMDDAVSDRNRLPESTTILAGETTFYTRITNRNTRCYDTSMITFSLDTMPLISLPEEYSVCINKATGTASDPVTISVDLPVADYDFVWTREYNGLREVLETTENRLVTNDLGIYKVDITSFLTGCSTQSQTLIRESSQPVDLEIESDFVTSLDSHEITIILEDLGDQPSRYQVRLEDGEWFDMDRRGNAYEYTFDRIQTDDGLQEVTVRDLQGCYYKQQELITIGVPQFFTPNGDGYNDTWNIRGGKNLDPSSQLLLYDRYGKLLVELEINGNGWDGTYNGEPLPSTDYWYTLTTANNKMTRGHFALKR
ncbi:T9SS type B sorting domain-containing protein [Nonlabens ponticola]|uniref:T9SS type B sorting domain-containing protein n=1 Tax=Nonlabens ponticola TaxID=2496866 RepID=A0A3S9N0M8_9FLAO|nr:T9SS type B sorting domain-containing protein [Nonlabens ponticola]AZQ44948.1 T9SS type B sorting domain-containing protein [Nonlabens ponticola]